MSAKNEFLTSIDLSLCLTLDREETETEASSEAMFDMVHSNFLEVGDIWLDRFIAGKGEDCHIVDTDELPPDLEGSCPRESWRARPNAYNAWKAHREIIKNGIHHNAENLLIVEEDCVLRPSYFDWVLNGASEFLMTQNWDMIYFGSYYRKSSSIEVHPNVIRMAGETGWHCVLINKRMFDVLLSLPALGPMDWLCADRIHQKHICYGLTPSVALQLETYSAVEDKMTNYNTHLV